MDNEGFSPSPMSLISSASEWISPTPMPIDSPGIFSPTPTPMPIDSQNMENPQDASPLDQVAENVIGGTAGKQYSKVWEHYHKMQVDGKWKAKCKDCGAMLLGEPRQGTSHLKKHQERCPRKKTRDIRQQILQANFNKEKFELSPFSFDKDLTRKDLAKMIIRHEYPLRMVEHVGFRTFCKDLNPLYQSPSRNTIKKDCIMIYESEKEATLQIF
ncbi:hypothetical protein ACS0TY_028614 [Phlomoides rotata]